MTTSLQQTEKKACLSISGAEIVLPVTSEVIRARDRASSRGHFCILVQIAAFPGMGGPLLVDLSIDRYLPSTEARVVAFMFREVDKRAWPQEPIELVQIPKPLPGTGAQRVFPPR